MTPFTPELFRDLYAHLEWADSQVWRVVLAASPAGNDPELKSRLFHIHLTQRAFLDIWLGRNLERYQATQFSSLQAVLYWAAPFYPEMRQLLPTLSPTRYPDRVTLPWARRYAERLGRQPNDATLGETLFQLTSHTTYHRAQVNTRLKALGVEPPMVDYIAWVWIGRPEPAWPAVTDGE